MFSSKQEGLLLKECGEVMDKSRILTTEYLMLAALILGLKTPAEAITSLNEHIRTLDTSNLSVTSLQATIWKFTQNVIKGGSVFDAA